MSVSTHVLDAGTGRPASGLTVRLEAADPTDGWVVRASADTDADGRIRDCGPVSTPGPHRLVFDTGTWFAARGIPAFYPEVTITFTVPAADDHLHVPLLLSPFAYSTYRGS